MTKILVDLVMYDMDKTKKRKRKKLLVEEKSEASVIQKLEQIHKGEKVQEIHKIVWGKEKTKASSTKKTFTGFIKFYDKEKGFGFIKCDADREDLFFHSSALAGVEFFDNDDIEFQIGTSPKGQVAISIKLIES